jgi:hypothetical protein
MEIAQCAPTGHNCQASRCCSGFGASCYRTYAPSGSRTATCLRACFLESSGQPCEVLPMCSPAGQTCTQSGCCASTAEPGKSHRCFEANSSYARCMPECIVGLSMYRGWSCKDRNGRVPADDVTANHGRPAATGVLGFLLTLIQGDLGGASNAVEHLGGQRRIAMLMTAVVSVVCCVVYVSVKISRAMWRPLNKRLKMRKAARKVCKARPRRPTSGGHQRLRAVDTDDNSIIE